MEAVSSETCWNEKKRLLPNASQLRHEPVGASLLAIAVGQSTLM